MGTPLALPLHLQIAKTRTVIQNAKVGNSIAKLVNTMPICPRIAKRLVNIAVNHFFSRFGRYTVDQQSSAVGAVRKPSSLKICTHKRVFQRYFQNWAILSKGRFYMKLSSEKMLQILLKQFLLKHSWSKKYLVTICLPQH